MKANSGGWCGASEVAGNIAIQWDSISMDRKGPDWRARLEAACEDACARLVEAHRDRLVWPTVRLRSRVHDGRLWFIASGQVAAC